MDTILELVLILIALAAVIGLPAIALMLPGADKREAAGGQEEGTREGQATLGDEAAQLHREVTELAERLPSDSVVLTLGCGKFRVIESDLGEVAGLPRLLDMGQCNDAFSAIKVAQALADAFEVGVNDLPLSLVISWYEQKAVLVLLALLHLGIRNIRLGPKLPAFLTPAILEILVAEFGIRPIGDVDTDLAEMVAA